MVRHGTAKKRRRGIRVTRKSQKKSIVKIVNAVQDKYMREIWDRNKTPAENIASLGLDPNPNGSYHRNVLKLSDANKNATDKNSLAFGGFVDLSKVKPNEINSNNKRRIMSEEDQRYA